MRRVSILLVSTSAVALLGSASAASAQTPPVAPATAQTNAAQADAAPTPAAQPADDNSIVVTGLRRALQSARNVKRNSDQIVDAIVAQDIGKLPDIAVSDTAARIPGIQVTRERGEADRVLVRGLDRTFYTTTYNGREIFTAETRSVALQDFPSGAIAALEAFKTSTANLIEPGIAGLVNVRSRRPFDFQGFELNGSFWELHPRQGRGWQPNGNVMITDRWRVGDGEMGALLNFSYTRLHYMDSIIQNAYFVAPFANNTRAPDWPLIEYDEATRYRPSLNGALQWRPNPNLELYVEGLWQGFRHEIEDRHFEQPIWGGASYTNLVTRDGNLVESGTVFNPRRAEGWQGGTFNKTNTYQFAAGGRYDAGPLRITADVARTNSTFTGHTESVDFRLCPSLPGNTDPFNCGQTVDFVIGAPGEIPSFNLVGFDPTNPNNYAFRGLFEENQQAKGKDWQGRLDFEYQTHSDFLPKIQWGVRYVDRNASRVYGNRYNNSRYGTPISAVPLDYELFSPGFRGANNPPFPLTWLAPTYSSIQDNIDALRTFSGYPAGVVPYDPLQSFKANEKSLAAYGQLNYQFGILDGQIGVRAVQSNRNVSGTRRIVVSETPFVTQDNPIDVTEKKWVFLPNINARFRFTPQLQLRLAATKTRTRPQFNDLNPSISLGSPSSCQNQTCPASGGNPFLKDLKATNFDASLEYYFSPTGYAAIAAFHHALKGFVTPANFIEPGAGYNGQALNVSAPINSDKGHVDGVELQANTFFDFGGVPEWLRSFGVQGNLTLLNAKAKYPNFGDTSDMVTRPLLNVSKWSYNIIGMFERGPVSVRLAYNKRGPYWADWSERNDFSSNGQNYVLRQKVREPGRLDLSASYTLWDRYTLFADWTNILSRPQKTDLVRIDPSGARFDPNGSVVDFAWRARYQERILSLGVRFRFGGEGHAAPSPPAPPPPPPPPPATVEPPAPPPAPPPPPVAVPERG
ncbi:MAG: TonB-dependent receptor [Sphingomonas sp.]|nr:TonB-dependent receptor [Sphingomonas sp.]